MKLIFLVGPTASGKSQVALALAKKISAEIISCDSMQVYQGMDILTSKVTRVFRRKIPHHLIDIISPDKEYNVALFCKETRKQIKEILRRGKKVLLVGGTGLYILSLIDGIFKLKSQDKLLRRKLSLEAQKSGSRTLHARLQKCDPPAAAKIHPHDTRRIIRALEVFYTTGKPISALQKEKQGLKDEYEVAVFGLNMPRSQLYQRIDARVDRMLAKGLVKEVRKLLKFKLSKTARAALGIKEISGYLDGLYDLACARRLIKQNTRRYAKRQLTWFRKDKRITWIDITDKEKPQETARKIWNALYW